KRTLGANAHAFEEFSPNPNSGLARGNWQRLLKARAIFEKDRISANRECHLGIVATGVDADRRARPARIGWPAVRLLDLKELHACLPSVRALMMLDVEGFAAAAASLFVGIAKGETALQLLLDIIHLGTKDEHHRLRINQDRHALVFDDLVVFALFVGIF